MMIAPRERSQGPFQAAPDRHIVDPPFPVKAVDDGFVPQLPLVIDMVIENRDIRTGIDMLFEGRIEIDLPDEVCVSDDNIARPLVGEEPAVIRKKIERVPGHCGSRVVEHRRQKSKPAVLAGEVPVPAAAQMLHQRFVLIAGNDPDVPDPRVNHVGKHKIDEPVPSPKRDGPHRPPVEQCAEQRPVFAGHDDAHCLILSHCSGASFPTF